MDAQTRKAMLRARMKEAAQKREKRIDSPLVRYNELDQAVCRVCNVVIKSESLWPAHQGSKKHNEAVENIKAYAAKSATTNDKKLTPTNAVSSEIRPSSSLPANFFDNPDAKRQNRGSAPTGDSKLDTKSVGAPHSQEDIISSIPSVQEQKVMTSGIISSNKEKLGPVDKLDISSSQPSHASNQAEKSEGNPVKGSLPEGFFDNKDADLRARGLEPIKYDIKDEWKEFQKTIQEDLQEVDYRLEEEEFDAAEVREEMEHLEQRAYMERIEMLKKKQQEISIAKASAGVKSPSYMGAESSDVSSSDEDEDEENYLIDWRAKHL
eukprot:Gb_32477 [translate_table: standard]